MHTESPCTAVNELLLEKFATLLAECDLVAETAGYGQTLDLMENFFSDKGRKFLNERVVRRSFCCVIICVGIRVDCCRAV